MLSNRSVFDLIHFEKLTFEDNEVAASLTAQINMTLLILFKGIHNLVKIRFLKEEVVIRFLHF